VSFDRAPLEMTDGTKWRCTKGLLATLCQCALTTTLGNDGAVLNRLAQGPFDGAVLRLQYLVLICVFLQLLDF
jgi:hypothetical protein